MSGWNISLKIQSVYSSCVAVGRMARIVPAGASTVAGLTGAGAVVLLRRLVTLLLNCH